MRYVFLLLALAFGAPVLMNATLFSPAAAGVPELAPWTLMLLGFAGFAVTLRARHGTLVAAG